MFEVVDDVSHLHSVEVINLAAAQDSRQDFVLLRCGQDEDGV